MKNYKDINKFKASVLDSVKEELSKLSPIKRWLFETLFDKIWAIFSDECSETEISSAINSLEKVNSEYVRPTDVLNYDESMRILNFSNNRVGFKRLMDAKGIEQVIFKNRKIGYRKSENLALKSELEAEQKAKRAKEKPYKQNSKAVNKKPKLSNMEKDVLNKRELNCSLCCYLIVGSPTNVYIDLFGIYFLLSLHQKATLDCKVYSFVFESYDISS